MIKQVLSAIMLCIPVLVSGQSPTKLEDNKPALFFEETYVAGNGKTGATIFGKTDHEIIYLNDATLWTGEPVDRNINPEGFKLLPSIREALKNEDYPLADKLNRKLQGVFSQSYAPLGTLEFVYPHSQHTAYSRNLNLEDAVITVRYTADGVQYKREHFISKPDNGLIIKLTANKKKSISFEMKFSGLLKYTTQTTSDILKADGYAPWFCAPGYRKIENPVRFDEKRGTRFSAWSKIKQKGGMIVRTDSSLIVKNADEVLILTTTATSFNGYDKNPATQGLDNKALAALQINKVAGKTYKNLLKNHLNYYQPIFKRVKLDLGMSNAPDLTTPDRLKKYATGKEDKNLEILYFNFGRYLLISASGTPGVPANLQGIWNPYLQPPWSSNYTTNINLQENYWPAETANLAEMHQPLLSFIENLAETGMSTARNFYGCNGWVLGHNSDIWAMTNPVGNYGEGDPSWANWNMGGAWIVSHLWEHYSFSKNEKFLREKAYPLMKGAAEFCLNWLVEDKDGYLITSPGTSPENKYITSTGYKGATLYGATADLAMIRQCLIETIKASKILQEDETFRGRMEQALDRLLPYRIGAKGHLQEWYHDWEDVDAKHRHQSHLYGLHPGNHISPRYTPAYAKACRKTLEIKGDETTGWSKGWRINLWARLADGNRAYKMLRELLRYVDPDKYQGPDKKRGGGTYPNLFDAHPPFQIDGNFGGTAAFIEMLLQSTDEEIILMPALPDAWNEGEISGIKARGNFEIAMQWSDNQLKEAKIISNAGSDCRIIHAQPFTIKELNLKAEKDEKGTYQISFKTETGKTYHLSTSERKYFVFSYFKNGGKDGLHLAGSTDGLNWTAFNNDSSLLKPEVSKDKLMRDPCIIRGKDGKFHMVWTVSWNDKGIGYASSENLIQWSEQKYLPVMEYADSARNAWAPEITFDPYSQTYVIYWSSTLRGKFTETQSNLESGFNHRIYYTSTKDFITFDDTKLLYDPKFNVIDATIVRDKNQWVMLMKDETREPAQKNIKLAYAQDLTGPWSSAGAPITGKTWVEGPTTLKIDGRWILYYDVYRNHRFEAKSSTDLLNWTDVSNQIILPKGIRHGSILEVPERVYQMLKNH